MSKTTSLILFLLLALVTGDLVAQSPAGRRRHTRTKQEKPLQERDPELYQWIETLVVNLQKDHKRIRNSAAQALISVGYEAGPALLALRERLPKRDRRLVNRILERITRGSGRNLFKADAGGQAPSNLVSEMMATLKIDSKHREKLKKVVTQVQEKRRDMDRKYRAKKINGRDRVNQLERLRLETEAELGLFLDQKAVEYIVIKLGLNPRGAKEGRRGGKNPDEEMERRQRNRESGGH